MENEIQVYESEKDLIVERPPGIVLQEAMVAAKALADVVSKKKKPVIMNGEQYLEFEDWQTVGRFYGTTAKVIETRYIEYGTAQGFEARAVALRYGKEISAAEAMCLNDEPNWKGKPLFQLKSMAQTRACAKSLRNVLAWVVVLAGYKPTPAEEMTGQEHKPPIQEPKKKNGDKEQNPTTSITVKEVIKQTKNKDGLVMKSPRFRINSDDGKEFITFSETLAKTASDIKGTPAILDIEYKVGQYGNDVINLKVVEPPSEEREPGSDG